MTGRFITLEGGEGVGKSTQLVRIADALRQLGHEVVTTREPGGTAGAEAIRDLLMTGDDDRWTAQAEALLFAAARSDHVSKVIRPALERGAWVVCDRYVDSTRAYQGGGGGVSDKDIMTLHALGSGGLLPERTILLDMAVDRSGKRVNLRSEGSADRMGSKSPLYQTAVRDRFLALAAAEPQRFIVVDADQSAELVTETIMSSLRDTIP